MLHRSIAMDFCRNAEEIFRNCIFFSKTLRQSCADAQPGRKRRVMPDRRKDRPGVGPVARRQGQATTTSVT
ncbi:hypothetical protein [Frigidibacter sp. MR17.24]|uniref:hypothetical protein n=1 Tax=Frigidibacter sp. MR17.24 TaxID=3127345 RepID=UPI0030130A3D